MLESSPTPSPIVHGPVLILGDSLIVGARDYGGLEQLLTDDGWQPEFLAEVGRSVPWAIDQMEARETVPAIVIVGLGSNPGPGLGTFPDEVTTLIEGLRARGARRILWLPPRHADPERYAERVAALDAAQDDAMRVLPWSAVIDEHPTWIGGDGLHLTNDGYLGLAAFLVERLDAQPAIAAEINAE